MEIGLGRGIAFYAVASALPKPATLVGIDLPGETADGRETIELVCAELQAQRHNPQIIWGDSQSVETLKQVTALAPFDLVFIDGGHSWDCIWADWTNYAPLARVVAFHDIDSWHIAGAGVAKLWSDLRPSYQHIEIIGEHRGMGIGIIWPKVRR